MNFSPLFLHRPVPSTGGIVVTLSLGLLTHSITTAAATPAVGLALRRYTSNHYAVRTTLGRSEAVQLAAHMDLVYAEYARRFQGFSPRGGEDMTLYLFRTPDEYAQFMAAMDIPAKNTAGIFFVHRHARGVATWVSGRSHDEILTVLQHEGFHQFAYQYLGAGLPIWVNEGLAQYFEHGILLQDEMKLGMANARSIAVVKEALEAGRDVAFDELMNMTPERWKRSVTTGGRRSTLFYAQSWSMVHFLVHGDNGRYRSGFDRYLAQIGNGRPSQEAFAQAFRTRDAHKFQDRWRQYMRNLAPDPLSTALARMAFLGEGLRYFAEKGEPAPENLDELRRRLQQIQFRTIFTKHGFQATTYAADQAVYAYTPSGGIERPFQLLASVLADLPPQLTAAGLQPEPTLTWRRDEAGALVQAIAYR